MKSEGRSSEENYEAKESLQLPWVAALRQARMMAVEARAGQAGRAIKPYCKGSHQERLQTSLNSS